MVLLAEVIYKKRAPAKIAWRVLWEEEQRAFGQSREERSGLRNLLRCDEAQGNPACAMIQKQKRGLARGVNYRSGENKNILASLAEGEQVLSWQRHGVALTTCELGNFPLWGNFLTEARALPRETSKPSGQAARNAAADLRALPRLRAPAKIA